MDYYMDPHGEQVSAMQVGPELVKVIAVWCGGKEVEEIDPLDPDKKYPAVNVGTPDGVKRASIGDFVLKRSNGAFDVKKPGEFARDHQHWEA